jgi:hypothetical protein
VEDDAAQTTQPSDPRDEAEIVEKRDVNRGYGVTPNYFSELPIILERTLFIVDRRYLDTMGPEFVCQFLITYL